MRETLIYTTGSRDVIQDMTAALAQRGLTVVRSFDLRAAGAGSAACACQDHTNPACECQLVVLLVYGRAGEPLSMVVTGYGGRTHLQIVQDATVRPDPRVAAETWDTLIELGARLRILPQPCGENADAMPWAKV